MKIEIHSVGRYIFDYESILQKYGLVTKFIPYKCSKTSWICRIEINSIEEIYQLSKELGQDLILSNQNFQDLVEWKQITIYDDYIE